MSNYAIMLSPWGGAFLDLEFKNLTLEDDIRLVEGSLVEEKGGF